MRTLIQVAVAAAVAALTAQASAEEYANSIRGGLYGVFNNSSATDVSGPFVPAGVSLKARDNTTLYLAYIRALSPQWDIELAGGVPPKSEVEGTGPAATGGYLGSVPYNGQVISTARWFSPSLLLEYKFMQPGSMFRPFLGAGLNYTHFYARKSTDAGNAANGGPTSISLSDSFGLVVTAGVNVALQDHWSLHASLSKPHIATNAETDTAGTIRKASINFRPTVLVLSVGYDF